MKNLTFRGIVIRKFLFKHTIEDISDAIFSRGIVFGSIDEIPVEFFSRLLIGSTFDLSEGAPDQQNTQQRCYLLHRIRRRCQRRRSAKCIGWRSQRREEGEDQGIIEFGLYEQLTLSSSPSVGKPLGSDFSTRPGILSPLVNNSYHLK